MDGRISLWFLTIPLTMLAAGCVTTQAKKTDSSAVRPSVRTEDVPVVKKPDGPKRQALPSTEIAFGKMKEAEADAETAKKRPEAQAVLRDEARKAYQQALKTDPHNLEAQRCLARLYTKMGDYERAMEIYKKTMAKHPKDASLWFDLGHCHNRRKDFKESARCYSKAVELDPENRDYLKQLGYTLAWSGQVDQGLVYLTRVHGAAIAQFKIACMYDQKEQRGPAMHHLRLALRENSELEVARDLLAALENPGANSVRRGSLERPDSVQ